MANETQTAVISSSGDILKIKGALTFATVPSLATLIKTRAGSGDSIVAIDLSGVTHSDSAGLALLLQWLGDAKETGGDLTFINIPDQVKDFISINGLASILVS